MNEELLTVKEFATIAGVSQQAIYKQLNNRLNNYVVIVENKKMLKIEALELFTHSTIQQEVEQQNNQLNNLVEQVELLKRELEEKNQQIRDLHKLLDQEQQLHLLDKQKVLELEDKMKAPETVEPEPEKKKWWKRIFE